MGKQKEPGKENGSQDDGCQYLLRGRHAGIARFFMKQSFLQKKNAPKGMIKVRGRSCENAAANRNP